MSTSSSGDDTDVVVRGYSSNDDSTYSELAEESLETSALGVSPSLGPSSVSSSSSAATTDLESTSNYELTEEEAQHLPYLKHFFELGLLEFGTRHEVLDSTMASRQRGRSCLAYRTYNYPLYYKNEDEKRSYHRLIDRLILSRLVQGHQRALKNTISIDETEIIRVIVLSRPVRVRLPKKRNGRLVRPPLNPDEPARLPLPPRRKRSHSPQPDRVRLKHPRVPDFSLPPVSPGYGYYPTASGYPVYGPQLPLGYYGVPCLPLPPPPPPPACMSQAEREQVYREAYDDCFKMISSV